MLVIAMYFVCMLLGELLKGVGEVALVPQNLGNVIYSALYYTYFEINMDWITILIGSDYSGIESVRASNLWHKGIHEIAAEGARNHRLLNIVPAKFFEMKLMIPQYIRGTEENWNSILIDLDQPHHSSPAKVRRDENLEKIYASKDVSTKWSFSSRN